MEIKLDIKCKWCNTALTYTLTGSLPDITILAEPCDRCSDDAMREAWNIIRNRTKEEPTHAEDDSEG